MNTCETYQAQLLNHLYDLLDEPERRELTEHLAGCPACRAALEAVRGRLPLLAAAAREQFPEVRFQAPPAEVLPLPPVADPPGSPRAGRRRWTRWAVAAAVLLAVAGVAGGLVWSRVSHLRSDVQLAQAHQQDLQKERDRLSRKRQDEEQRYQKQVQAAQQEIARLETARRRQLLQVRVTGPETLQAGARNRYTVHTENLVNEPVPSRVDVRLRDLRSRQVVFEQHNLRSDRGACDVLLPTDLPQKPGTRFALEVDARGDNGGRIRAGADKRLQLVAPLYLTHLATDKPMYQPGEVVHFRSLTLERYSLKPVTRPLTLTYRVTDPAGTEVFRAQGESVLRYGPEKNNAPVLGPDGKPVQGVGTGDYPIPATAPGGVYTLRVRVTDQTDRPSLLQEQTRSFLVNRYEKPRLNKEVEFTRKSYGPGDEVVAAGKVARAEGGTPLAGQPVRATVKVDGKTYDAAGKPVQGPYSGIAVRTDAGGRVRLRFQLPARIEVGEASLAVRFTDGARHETLVRPVPVVLKKLAVEFFPEGGELVAGAVNRVYFQVRTPRGKPAELKGRVVDPKGNVVARVETLHDDREPGANQGMGVFTLRRPTAGVRYELKIDSPAGIEGRHELPKVKADGVVLNVPAGVVTERIPVVLRNGPTGRRLLVGAYCRGRLLDRREVTVAAGAEARVELKPDEAVGGVYRVTVFEARSGKGRGWKAVAERLVYRRPANPVRLSIEPDKGRYVPGERVRLTLQAADERQRPVPAILLVSAVDQSVLTLADEKTARAMPTHFFLTTEVRDPEDLEYADFLVGEGPLAEKALDLLLGTQGWRRFAEQQDPEEILKAKQKDAERLVLAEGRRPVVKAAFAQPPQPGQDPYQEKIARQQAKLQELHGANLRAAQEHVQADLTMQTRIRQASPAAAERRLDDYLRTLGLVGRALLALLLGAVGTSLLAVGVTRAARSRVASEVYTALGVCGLTAFVIVAVLAFASFQGAFREKRQPEWANHAALRDRAALGDARQMMPPAPAAGDAAPRVMDLGEGALAPGAAKGLKVDGMRDGGEVPPPPVVIVDEAARGAPAPAMDPVAPAPRDLVQLRLGNNAILKLATRGEEQELPAAAGLAGFGARAGAFGERAKPWAPISPFVVREYAHRHQPGRPGVRTDFAETLYWNPVLVLADGKGEVTFDLCDSVTTFRVLAFAHTLDGRLGAATTHIESRLPFTLHPEVPVEVTANDKITVPLAVTNATDTRRSVQIHAEAKGLRLLGSAEAALAVPGQTAVRRLYHLRPTLTEGKASLFFQGRCEPFAVDRIERTFTVVPDGFPVAGSHSDLLEKSARHTVLLPKEWVPGTLKLHAEVYPSTLADLQKGLEGMLQEPNGCFEQTSSSNYPNILILDYLSETDQASPEVVRRARELLDRGYQRLTSFECLHPETKRWGYEWFGGMNPPHEALTAYGLLEFRDMARHFPVDPAMVKRTRQYLLDQRDGKGGFKRNPQAIDGFGRAPQDITDAYIVWALTEGGKDDVTKELAALTEQAQKSDDPYFLALVANSLLNRGQGDDGRKLLRKLAEAQKDDGRLEGARMSITGSGGRDLQIETTALTVLAWLKSGRPEFTPSLQKAVRWLGQQRGPFGAFGSTQATILALKALIAHTRANKKTAEAGELTLSVNGRAVGRLAFPAGAQGALMVDVPDADKVLRPGKNEVRLAITGKNVFPYTLSWSYRTPQPANPDHCPVHVATRLDRTRAAEADTVRLTARVENRTGKGQGMAVAIIGLPGGLTVPEDMKQLKDYVGLRDKGTRPGAVGRYVSAFELRGRELVLYWRDLAPAEKIEVNVDLICRVPGEYRGPASRAYLYYNADRKFWCPPLAVTIQARGEK